MPERGCVCLEEWVLKAPSQNPQGELGEAKEPVLLKPNLT